MSIKSDAANPDIGAWMYADSGDQNPEVIIDTPTINATYQTSVQTLTISGTASDDDTVASVAWACPTCTPTGAACVGTTAWSYSSITLGSTDNVITVTATDNTSNAGYDVITVTYPIPTYLPLQGVVLQGKYN